MAKKITVKIATTPEELVESAKLAADIQKGVFEGDTSEGTFKGHGVEGSYRFEGEQVHLTIHKKPLLLPWTLVKTGLKDFWSKGMTREEIEKKYQRFLKAA